MLDSWPLFVACAPGLEALLAQELQSLGLGSPAAQPGGVALDGDREAMMHINLWSGLATHVLVRVAAFEARHFSALAKRAGKVPWSQLLRPDVSWSVRATCRRSKLYHSDAVAQRVTAAITKALGGPSPSPDDKATKPEVEVAVRLDRDRCQLSIDTSGAPLHRRGWRQQTAKAPLREDLAHAMLLSTWDQRAPLIDPMMGSGTIVIEAACIARKLAPGRLRQFAFERTHLADAAAWQAARDRATEQVRALNTTIVGRDRNGGALDAAQGNAARAGVDGDLTLERADLASEPLPSLPGAHVITNPPYGQRIDGSRGSLNALGARLAETSAQSLGLIYPVDGHANVPGVRLKKLCMTDHGGTKVAISVAELGPIEPT